MREGGRGQELERRLRELGAALDRALAEYRESTGPVSLLFSGGVDSALLAWELRGRLDLRLVTIGLPGASDLGAARLAAQEMGLRWTPSEISPDEVAASYRAVEPELRDVPVALQSVFVALDLAIDHVGSTGPVLCGQGADELFLGYAHYRGLSASDAAALAETDLARLRVDDWPRTQRIAARRRRTLVAPYLDSGWIAAAQNVPIEARQPRAEAKELFRSLAIYRGVPESIARRPKRAMQYGSGVDRALRQNGFAPRGNQPYEERRHPPGPRIK
jgi:asparagine synthase (glutamine-hydrolysing)